MVIRRLASMAVGWLGLLAMVAIGAGPAHADERDARAVEAKKACLGGHADRGIELLAELYAETNDPTYIYNQGRCFEQNGRAVDAITRFREYLRKASGISAGEKTDVEGRIAELEKQARGASAPAAAAPAAPVAAPTPAGLQLSPTSARPTESHRTAGIIVGGAGVLAIAGGVVMGLRARALSADVTKDAYDNGHFSQSQYDAGRLAERLEWVGYGVGAAALISGAFLYYWSSWHHLGEPGAAAVAAVVVAPDGRGAALRVRF